jgi:hypothetical protein
MLMTFTIKLYAIQYSLGSNVYVHYFHSMIHLEIFPRQ